MFEVEAKTRISAAQVKTLEERLKKEGASLGQRKNEDTYYENPRKAFIRVRRRGDRYTFDIKLRQTVEGIESNIESEWGIAEPEKWKKLLAQLDIKPTIRKIKTSKVFRLGGFTVELNEVGRLGHFLEIEKLVPKKAEVKKAKAQLVKLFSRLGYRQTDFEPRPYLELLKNIR